MKKIDDNLIQAMQVEADYLKLNTIEDQDEFKYDDKLSKLGFASVREFLRAKANTHFQREGVAYTKEISPEGIFPETKAAIEADGNVFLFVKPDQVCVYNGITGYNKEYTDANNIPVYEIGYSGGTIVANETDVAFIIVTNDNYQGELASAIDEQILNYLGLKEDDVEFDGNDILVGGRKAFSRASKDYGKRFVLYYQLSFSIDMEKIRNICTKEMKKVPLGVGGFGNHDRDGLIRYIKEWL